MKRLTMGLLAALCMLTSVMASAADLLLGAGDVVKVSVYGNPDLGVETRISEGGLLTFPLLGTVPVAGMSVAAAEKKLSELLESGGFVRKAQVNIIVTVMQSQLVSVLGQVNRPGRYPVDGQRSVMDMLATAGGIAVDGGDSVSLIRKRGGTTSREVIDVVDLVRKGSVGAEFEVNGGDVIYVERSPRFYIYGEVQRPGTFRLERSMTVLQALSTGGGLTPRGTERGMQIKRRDASGKLQVLDAKHDELLQADDVVYVKESLF